MSNTEQEPEVTETRSLGQAIEVLSRAMHVNHLVYTAGDCLDDADAGDAIAIGADIVHDLLKDVRTILYAHIRREQAGPA